MFTTAFKASSLAGLCALFSLGLGGGSAIAAVPSANPVVLPTELPSTRPVPRPLVLPTENETSVEGQVTDIANYSDGRISIDYPITWQVAISESGEVSITSTDVALPTASAARIATQVFRVAAPPGPLVNANIDSFIEEGAAVSRYSSVEIDEQSALVIWLADRPDELSSAIATFIGYGDETIFLFSRYSPDNESAENSILRLHSSFTNLESGPEPSE